MSTGELSTPERVRVALAHRFTLLRELGRGATATVYLATDLRHRRDVAVKVLRPDIASVVGRERFEREIQIEAQLQHPGILPLYDSGSSDDLFYYVMPYISGGTLRLLLKERGPLPVDQAVRLATRVLEALACAHEAGVVHRDVKPENILLHDGEPLLADFGIARVLHLAGSTLETTTGIMVGTPTYVAPEQATGSRSIDGRADLYAVACVLYEMLVGEPPFTGPTPQAVVARHIAETPRSIRVVRASVPPALERAIMRGLAKVPADRFGSTHEFAAALDQALREPQGPETAPVQGSRLRSWRGWLVGCLVLAVAATMVWTLRQGPRHPALDPNRVVVFPLSDSDEEAFRRGSGEDAATYLGHVLDGTAPLRWEEARDWSPVARQPVSTMRAAARRHGAAYFIDGAILRRPDSVTVVLRLFDVDGDSLLNRTGATGEADTSVAQLAAHAVISLLPALLAPAAQVDIGDLRSRAPAVIANLLRGERAYRQMRFAEALASYQAASGADSTFAVAHVGAARAAEWLGDLASARDAIGRALQHEERLPPRVRALAQGLRQYYAGEADSALAALDQARRLDPRWIDPIMARGEVLFHELPSVDRLDTMARSAFDQVLSRDSSFLPALFHRGEIAFQAGDTLTGNALALRVARVATDTVAIRQLDLMQRCARGALSQDDWTARVTEGDVEAVLGAAKALAFVPGQRGCAADGFSALVRTDAVPAAYRYYALLGQLGLAVHAGDATSFRRLVESPAGRALRADYLYLIGGLVLDSLIPNGDRKASELGARLGDLPARQLLLLGVWRAHRGDVPGGRAVEAALARLLDSTADPTALAAHDVVRAHLALAEDDTAQALSRLAALRTTADPQQVVYSPWQSLGYEHLVLARLRAATADDAGVIQACAVFDSSQPLTFLMFSAGCDRLRADAARRRGDAGRARELERRLAVSPR